MNKENLRLYFIYGADKGNIENSLYVIEEALKSGVTMFQLREKGEGALHGRDLEHFALSVKSLTEKYDVPFIINDDVELAVKTEADGIHIGQDDIKPADLPASFVHKIVGLSVGNEDELAASNLENVDYIGAGPVFATLSKEDAGNPIGTPGLTFLRNNIGELPMVAIGGITHENYTACLTAGADGVAVISAIANADDVQASVKTFLN